MKTQMQVDIAIDELFSNIVRDAYNPKVGMATVRLLAKAYPDTALSDEEREIGGLDIY